MKNLGSGENGEYTYLDVLNILSFVIGLQNLDMNVSQNDMQNLQSKFNEELESVVREIHQHLEKQDDKIDEILKRLN